jgi:glutamate synthase domain-containing protein 3
VDPVTTDRATIDLVSAPLRELNAELHAPASTRYEVLNPKGAHAVAAGVRHPIDVQVRGHAGYYCAGMNDGGTITVHGNVGTGVAENMMSGTVRVRGDASQSAGATAHGGLLVIEGSASMRCGISMKGVDIVVGGDIGPMSAFMAQAGRLVVCGDTGDDCVEKPVRDEHRAELAELLAAAGLDHDAGEFRRFGSARQLYHFAAHNTY